MGETEKFINIDDGIGIGHIDPVGGPLVSQLAIGLVRIFYAEDMRVPSIFRKVNRESDTALAAHIRERRVIITYHQNVSTHLTFPRDSRMLDRKTRN